MLIKTKIVYSFPSTIFLYIKADPNKKTFSLQKLIITSQAIGSIDIFGKIKLLRDKKFKIFVTKNMARQRNNEPTQVQGRQPRVPTPVRKKNWRSRLRFLCSRKKRAQPSATEQFAFLGSGMLLLLFPIIFTYWPGAYLFQEVGILYPYLAHFNYIAAVCCFVLTSFNDPGKNF